MKARPLNYRDMRLMGYRIAILRTKSNLTQVVFGEKYGVNRFAVIRWEHGVHVPKMNKLKQIAKDYNTTVEWLLYGEGEKNGNV
ncbi:XRE family transcriptional regulator [Staphylococcus gallinarum]|uniref:helix-turn-helix domain-containing protein n=1 Tax=Staphylococcus gallinarum TaxID=1293 RepID=UPI000D1E95EC|nr:helix-turn-helix transcriptional regulator [Staphylococcus gallinarum]PTK92431.1 XRE family transcriptional regulator [Staphylococcus gallinarum]PTL09371.1 XRE family transcriptional regulator [Staphylococcus gallinarum]RIL23722.1 XRE family transcriptional regulator [Staphylococcus gallinarum]RIL24706.1 XRE family transcriptional regulator [Staphylococcus gallinarum]RIL28911.1 XRE family transcriptional regulator [Staphylococcus gallinarum]